MNAWKIYENDRVEIKPKYRAGLTDPQSYTGTAVAGERLEEGWAFRVEFDDGGIDIFGESELQVVTTPAETPNHDRDRTRHS